MKRWFAPVAVMASALLLPVLGFADPVAAIDVTDVETSFSNQVTPITTVLTTVLGISVLVAVFGLIKRVAR